MNDSKLRGPILWVSKNRGTETIIKLISNIVTTNFFQLYTLT